MADFRYRFGREAESMWLPETACNDDVLGLLIEEGLRFVILAPQQAERVRTIRTELPDFGLIPKRKVAPRGQIGTIDTRRRLQLFPSRWFGTIHRRVFL